MGIDDPMLSVMAEIISLPQRMMAQMTCDITAQHLRYMAMKNRAEYNSKAANDMFEFLRSQRKC